LIAGNSGGGKTTYAERYMIGSHHPRIFIFDHQDEFNERLHLPVVYDFDDIRRVASTERFVCFDYAQKYPGQLNECFDEFCTEIFAIAKDHLEPSGVDCLLVCDEVQKCVTPNLCPFPLKNVLQTGRRFGVDSLCMTQQPNRIHNEQREQTTELVLFNLMDENSLKFVSQMGKSTEDIQRLKRLQYKWHDLRNGEERFGELKFDSGSAKV
jgi:hypothetical protein